MYLTKGEIMATPSPVLNKSAYYIYTSSPDMVSVKPFTANSQEYEKSFKNKTLVILERERDSAKDFLYIHDSKLLTDQIGKGKQVYSDAHNDTSDNKSGNCNKFAVSLCNDDEYQKRYTTLMQTLFPPSDCCTIL